MVGPVDLGSKGEPLRFPLRRSGSGLLQIPPPGLLPSSSAPRLGPLEPSRENLTSRVAGGNHTPRLPRIPA